MFVAVPMDEVSVLFCIPNGVNLRNRLLATVRSNVDIVARLDHTTADRVILLIVIVVVVRLCIQCQNVLWK